MSSAALVWCLGVPGWGPRQWLLCRGGDRQAVLARLQQAWWQVAALAEGDPPAALLLAGLLRSQPDLLPLAVPLAADQTALLRYRHRLVCRPDQRWLHLRSWQRRSAALPWHPCGRELRLDAALLGPGPLVAPPRLAAASPAALVPSAPGAVATIRRPPDA